MTVFKVARKADDAGDGRWMVGGGWWMVDGGWWVVPHMQVREIGSRALQGLTDQKKSRLPSDYVVLHLPAVEQSYKAAQERTQPPVHTTQGEAKLELRQELNSTR